MLEDIILGLVSAAAEDLLKNQQRHSWEYDRAIRFLQHYDARKAYLSTDINSWGDDSLC